MIRGELDVLKDWCYEAVSEMLQVYRNMTDRSGFRPQMAHFVTFLGVFTQTVNQG